MFIHDGIETSVVDPHHLDADPDSDFLFDADPDPTFHHDAGSRIPILASKKAETLEVLK